MFFFADRRHRHSFSPTMLSRQVTRSSSELFWRLLLVLAVAAVAAKYLSRIRLSESERDPDPFVMPPGN